MDEGLTNKTGFGDVYLGGNDIEEEGAWKWTDCSPWDVEFWNPGEPNNGGGIRDCLQHYQLQKTWDDDYCFNDKSFLCSKRMCTGKHRHRPNIKKHLFANSVSQNSSSIFTCLYVCMSVFKRDISIYINRMMF